MESFITRAREFALEAHGSQQYGSHPYSVHLDAVAELAKEYGETAQVSGDLELALTVKAADRPANLRACVADGNDELLSVYKGEHEAFKKAAYRQDQCFSLWHEMDEICASAQHGGYNYRFYQSPDFYSLIRRRHRPGELLDPEIQPPEGKWVAGPPSVMDAIYHSCGPWKQRRSRCQHRTSESREAVPLVPLRRLNSCAFVAQKLQFKDGDGTPLPARVCRGERKESISGVAPRASRYPGKGEDPSAPESTATRQLRGR